MSVVGVGVDLVDLDAFAKSLAEPGTRMSALFSAAELRQARERAAARGANSTSDLARHLGARWAGKEAFIKAWSAGLYGSPPVIPAEQVRWSEIEIIADAWGRPGLRLRGAIAAAVTESLGSGMVWHVSLSHEGSLATAYVVAERSTAE